jgi:hypothetical protein
VSAECPGNVSTRPIPLPIYATDPNEGSTFGVLPVFLRTCDETKRTETIIAPSLTWNSTIHGSASMRYYLFSSDIESLTVIASVSSRINSNAHVLWSSMPLEQDAITKVLDLRWERSVFYRFFGIGPDTTESGESSYTRIRAHANARGGLNLGGGWNLGLEIFLHYDGVQAIGVAGFPLSPVAYPNVPGMNGSTILGQSLDLRYDSRLKGDYSLKGAYFDIALGPVEGNPSFARGRAQLRVLAPELDWVSFAGRVDVSYTSSSNAPFYDQSALGGEYLLRGFPEGRFVDQNAWTIEAEQRLRIVTTHILGVTADWRIDPFVGIGQVFGSIDHALSHPRPVGGVGFRTWVHPNVVGRVDVATGGEGIKIYVDIGYPY